MKARWQTKRLGELIKLQYGKPLPDEKRKADGKYPVYGANGEKDRTDEFYFDKPTIIVGRKGSAGEINLTEERFWPLDVTYFVEFDEKELSLKFLYNLLDILDLPKLAKGVKPGINRNEVYSIGVKVPPLPEQQCIVAILDEAFAGIATATANAKRNLNNARELFDAHVQRFFFNTEAGWEEKKLADVVSELITGPFGSMLHKSDYVDDGIPVVNPQNMIGGKIIPLKKTMVSVQTKDRMAKYCLRENDIVIARRGEMGRCGIVDKAHAGWLCGTGSMVIRLKVNANVQYITQLLQASTVRKRLEGDAIGAAMSNLNQAILLSVKFRLPPVHTQQAIIAKLDELSTETKKLEAIYQQKLVALEELKKSLLQRAFSGEL